MVQIQGTVGNALIERNWEPHWLAPIMWRMLT